MFCLNKDKVLYRIAYRRKRRRSNHRLRCRNGLYCLSLIMYLLYGLIKSVKSNWLQQIIRYIKIIAFQGILRISSGQYIMRLGIGNFKKLYPGQFGHLNIQKHKIYTPGLYQLQSFNSILGSLNQFKKGNLRNIIFYDIKCK